MVPPFPVAQATTTQDIDMAHAVRFVALYKADTSLLRFGLPDES